MQVTVQCYLTSFRTVYGWFRLLPFVTVIADSILNFGLTYPPLGDEQLIGAFITFLMLLGCVMGTFLLYSKILKRQRPYVWAVCVVAFVPSAVWVVTLHAQYVRSVPVLGAEKSVTVSIGSERSQFANQNYRGWPDVDMLHDRGPSEDSQVKLLWTPESVAAVRRRLWLSYTFLLGAIVTGFSIMVFIHCEDALRSTQ